MNKNQLIAMWIGIAIIALMGLFPPFMSSKVSEDREGKDYIYFMGYHFFITSEVTRRLDKTDTVLPLHQKLERMNQRQDLEQQMKQQYQNDLEDDTIKSLVAKLYQDEPYPYTSSVKIAYKYLWLQWFLVALIIAGFIVTLRDNVKSKKSSSGVE
ncbi:hypothetical protein KKB99_02775 [bacterium]|nr:hypothetical protein [bacterium]MBU1024912.1 hypothetical protein [bacterium]